MKILYAASYEPPFPVAQVVLDNTEEDRQTAALPALIDTGSDGSLVPLVYRRQILAPVLTETRIRSHWGESRVV